MNGTEIIPGDNRRSWGRSLPNAAVVRTDGPTRLSDDGTGLGDLPDGTDFLRFGEGHA